jgi:hypothetical protein
MNFRTVTVGEIALVVIAVFLVKPELQPGRVPQSCERASEDSASRARA